MTVRFDFNWIEETHRIIDDEFQVTVTVGNKGDIQSRDTFEEGLLYFSETTAEIKEHILDEESSHIVYRPNHFILIQGRIQSCQRWSEEDGIEAKDIERLKEISSNFIESSSLNEITSAINQKRKGAEIWPLLLLAALLLTLLELYLSQKFSQEK